MKITIDLEDFYIDENEHIEPELRKFIVRQAVLEINKNIEDKIKNQVFEEIKCLVNNILTKEVNQKVKSYLTEGKVKSRRNSSEISIEERIKEDYEYEHGYGTMKEQVKILAKGFADEMKKRYDLLFASQLVAKMLLSNN